MERISVAVVTRAVPKRWFKAILYLVILILFGLVVNEYASLPSKPGIDFYSFWVVAEAQQLSGYALGSPYTEEAQYTDAEKQLLMGSDDLALWNSLYWHGPRWNRPLVLFPTPLLYTTFALFPRDYSQALSIYRWTALVGFVAGSFLLMKRLTRNPLYSFFLSFLLLLVFGPLEWDLWLGNVNSLLFFSLAGLLGLGSRTKMSPQKQVDLRRLSMGACLIFLVLFKPLVLIPCLLLAMHLFLEAEARERIAVGWVMAGTMVLCFGVFCWFFRSWSVWIDWLNYLRAHHQYLLASRTPNYSLVMHASEWSGIKPWPIGLLLGVLMLLQLFLLARKRGRSVLALRDSLFLLSAGIVLALATSPLVWLHYYVLGLIPAMWLLSRVGPKLLLLSLVLATWLGISEDLHKLLRDGGLQNVGHFLGSVAWIPLWVGLLIVMGFNGRPSFSGSYVRV